MINLNQRGVAYALIVLILLAGLFAGVILSQRQQIFKPKAATSVRPAAGQTAGIGMFLFQPYTQSPENSFNMHVHAYSDVDSVNLVAVKLSFDPAKLEVLKATLVSNATPLITEQTFDNTAGTVSVIGGAEDPGYKSSPNNNDSSTIAIVEFKLKTTTPSDQITVSSRGSAIYRNSDNLNLLEPYDPAKSPDLTFSVAEILALGHPRDFIWVPPADWGYTKITDPDWWRCVVGTPATWTPPPGVVPYRTPEGYIYLVAPGNPAIASKPRPGPTSAVGSIITHWFGDPNFLWEFYGGYAPNPTGPGRESCGDTAPSDTNLLEEAASRINDLINPSSSEAEPPGVDGVDGVTPLPDSSLCPLPAQYQNLPPGSITGILECESQDDYARRTESAIGLLPSTTDMLRPYYMGCSSCFGDTLGKFLIGPPMRIAQAGDIPPPRSTLQNPEVWTLEEVQQEHRSFYGGGAGGTVSSPSVSTSSAPPVAAPSTVPGTTNPPPAPSDVRIQGDINNNNNIDLGDLSGLYSKFNQSGSNVGRADLNSDTVVNTNDYSIMRNILIQNNIIGGR